MTLQETFDQAILKYTQDIVTNISSLTKFNLEKKFELRIKPRFCSIPSYI